MVYLVTSMYYPHETGPGKYKKSEICLLTYESDEELISTTKEELKNGIDTMVQQAVCVISGCEYFDDKQFDHMEGKEFDEAYSKLENLIDNLTKEELIETMFELESLTVYTHHRGWAHVYNTDTGEMLQADTDKYGYD